MLKRLLRPGYKKIKRGLRPWWVQTRSRLGEGEYEMVLRNAMNFAQGCEVAGDYLEFGVSWGNTFLAAYHNAQRAGLTSMRFYGFDSFEGLPEISGVDKAGECHYRQGQYACTMEAVRERILSEGVDPGRIQFIKGWYDKTLTPETRSALPIKKAAVIWIDCDLYESTVPALNFVTDYVQDGTIICFDDWFCFKGDPDRGESLAFKEWLGRNPSFRAIEYRKFEAAGHSFILNVKR